VKPNAAPEEQIGYLLKRLQQAFRNLLETRLRQGSTGLSLAHLVTLNLLDELPGLPGAQLAKRLTVTAQTMNQMLQRLELQGEIERRPNPANRRADRWFLRPAGKRQMQSARAEAGPVMTQMLSLLQPAEVTQLRRFLELCVAGIEAGSAPGDQPAARSTPPQRRAAAARLARSVAARRV
jgi:DNA-binding MarR family transcriptional regulator